MHNMADFWLPATVLRPGAVGGRICGAVWMYGSLLTAHPVGVPSAFDGATTGLAQNLDVRVAFFTR